MNIIIRHLIAAILCGAMFAGCAATPVMPDWPAIKIELETLFKTDQAMRTESNTMLANARAKGIEADKAEAATLWKRISEQDGANQRRIAEIIDQYGWPKQSQVGPLAATAVFLVVQHADLAYQLKYIDHMRAAAMAGDASKQNIALLEDRVLIRQGKPQRYGSQVDTKNGVSIKATEDEGSIDARRAAMGLEPICQYLGRFVKTHGKIAYPQCVKEAPDAK